MRAGRRRTYGYTQKASVITEDLSNCRTGLKKKQVVKTEKRKKEKHGREIVRVFLEMKQFIDKKANRARIIDGKNIYRNGGKKK